MLGGKGDAIFAAKARYFEAVSRAAFIDRFRADIMVEFIQEILSVAQKDAEDLLFHLGYGSIDIEDWERLHEGMENLLSVKYMDGSKG